MDAYRYDGLLLNSGQPCANLTVWLGYKPAISQWAVRLEAQPIGVGHPTVLADKLPSDNGVVPSGNDILLLQTAALHWAQRKLESLPGHVDHTHHCQPHSRQPGWTLDEQ